MTEFWLGGALVAAAVGVSLQKEGHLTINGIMLGILFWPLFWLLFLYLTLFPRKKP